MSDRTKHVLLTISALIVSILPPLAAAIYFFPLWIERSAGATLSGTICVLGLLALVPLGKYIVRLMRSPSAPMVWGAFTVVMFIAKEIPEELFVVGVIGTVANVIGMALFKLGRMYARRDMNDG